MAQAEIGGVRLNFEQEGSGTDLVLVHGLGGDLHVWDADVPVFARHHRVTRVDLRGFGTSDKPPGPYSLGGFASDLDRMLTAAGVGDAHVCGISMGGVIAQRFAFDFPHRLRSVVLVSTSSEVGRNSIAAWQRLADQIERDGFDPQTSDASRAFAPSFAQQHPEILAEMARRNAANDQRSYAAAARAVSDYNWTAELANLSVPALILQGLDDQMTPPGGSVKMSRALRFSRLLMVAAAGHNLPLEQPAIFWNSVLAFTAGVDFARARHAEAGAPN